MLSATIYVQAFICFEWAEKPSITWSRLANQLKTDSEGGHICLFRHWDPDFTVESGSSPGHPNPSLLPLVFLPPLLHSKIGTVGKDW